MNLQTINMSLQPAKKVGAWILISTLLAIIAGFFTAVPAHAAETCSPSSSNACVQGIIKSSDKEPLAGVVINVVGPEGELQATTGEDGRWVVSVETPGEYTANLDVESLPEGQFPAQAVERVLQVELKANSSALFPLTDDEEAAVTDSGTGGATSSAKSSFSWPRFWQQFVSGIRLGLLIALASLGLSLIFGTTGISNFSQGEMVSMGGLMAAAFMTITGNLLIAGILAVLSAAIFGWVQDVIIWRPLRKRGLSLMQLLIVSIGLSIMMQYTFQYLFGAGVVRIDSRTPATTTILGITLTNQSYLAMAVAIVAILGVGFALMFTRFGRATRAISDNPALAEASGINVDKIVRIVWIVGSGLAGLAGVFLGLIFNGINWFTGGQMLLLFFAAVTLGGLGTAFGAFVGSMIIGIVVEMTNIWLPGDLKYATALFILILILLIRPQGLFGRKERIG